MAFIFKVQTSGVDDTFTLPLISGGTYDFNVDWGDDSNDDITVYDDAATTHTYASEDEYTITITGTLYGWRFYNGGDCAKMRDVSDWGAGVFRMGATTAHFYGCSNMTCSAANAPDITGTTSLSSAWHSCSSLASLALTDWDVSSVTSFYYCWYSCSSLTSLGDLSGWDVSKVHL
jgi:surface protein